MAHHGDRGSKLPALPTGTVWKAGGTAEVKMMMMTIRRMIMMIMAALLIWKSGSTAEVILNFF